MLFKVSPLLGFFCITVLLGTASQRSFSQAVAAPASGAHHQEEPPAPRQFVTHHRARIAGKELAYTAIAGDTHLTNLAGDWVGDLFSFTYLNDDSTQRNRPVLFVFNGGPGSSSVWLHLGIMGPRRVVLTPTINPSVVPPFGLEDNPNCPLDVADVVFIDPIGTGFSHLAGKGTAADFYGVDADANMTAQFIERWLTRHGRWNSPKFLMGESYGSMRAAVLPGALMGGPTTAAGIMRGITVNGVILLGTTLTGHNGQPSAADRARQEALKLPSLAATAWYHRPATRPAQTLAAWHDEAAQFAEQEYLPGLLRADRGQLTPAERTRLLGKLTHYTGLPTTAFSAKLRLSQQAFARQLLAKEKLTVGMYDSRYTLPTRNAGSDPVADDPAMGQYVPGFMGAFHGYLLSLGVHLEQPYGAIVWQGLNTSWNWDRPRATSQNTATELATAMRNNSKLRVLVAAGYYDLVTTAAAARSEMEQAHPPADRVTYRTYASGHMLYLGETAEAFAQDVRALIRSAR